MTPSPRRRDCKHRAYIQRGGWNKRKPARRRRMQNRVYFSAPPACCFLHTEGEAQSGRGCFLRMCVRSYEQDGEAGEETGTSGNAMTGKRGSRAPGRAATGRRRMMDYGPANIPRPRSCVNPPPLGRALPRSCHVAAWRRKVAKVREPRIGFLSRHYFRGLYSFGGGGAMGSP
ncbi:hypothetical protein LX32DRAFT_111775 [Colletotrichum zoysiae]|uniref:Uncharacterized protein n=1 Tax=Colletotrichum zoysiae TaxID=1216348 RepID=A0AAD9H9V8_9PEZI|nr:hypothetical protein LX32DRAFT_111775 [Colletotrichum zoysiae]